MPFVSVDARGTGESFGSRPLDLFDREEQDFAEITTWTRNQTFCNGRIGTGGISYDGITGALAAAGGGIDAVALLFSPTDIWKDIAFVGGIPTIGFIDLYGKFTAASERNVPVNDVDNELPAAFKLVSNWALGGVAPVYGAETHLSKAIQEHEQNLDMLPKARDPTVQTKDSTLITTPDGVEHMFQDLGITPSVFEKLIDNQVSVYSVAGYFESGSVRSATALHNYMLRRGGDSKLTIGPWTHGARACWTPTHGADATKTQYPLFADVKRFFDCRLKDQCDNGIDQESLLHHFLSGSDKWKDVSDEWPSTGLVEREWTLDKFGIVSNPNTVVGKGGQVKFTVDFTATTGAVSR